MHHLYILLLTDSVMDIAIKWTIIPSIKVHTYKAILMTTTLTVGLCHPRVNPIKNVWHKMKQYLRSKHKPKSLEELKQGVINFWHTLTPAVCRKYINHLILKVFQVDGDPSGH